MDMVALHSRNIC